MTITGQSTLDKDDIDQMVKDAEAHAEEDKARREEAENNADSSYQTEKVLREQGENVSDEEKAQLRDHSLNSRRAKAPILRRSSNRSSWRRARVQPEAVCGGARDNAAELQHQDLQMSQQMMTSLMLRLSMSNE